VEHLVIVECHIIIIFDYSDELITHELLFELLLVELYSDLLLLLLCGCDDNHFQEATMWMRNKDC